MLLLILQFFLNNYSESLKEKENQNFQAIRDSIQKVRYDSSLLVMKIKYDSSHNKTVSIITETLGKYGFKLDSTNRSLYRIDPILQVCGNLKGIFY